MAQGRADIWFDTLREERWMRHDPGIQLGSKIQVVWQFRFPRTSRQCVQFLRIAGIGQLANQVGGADKASLAIGVGVIIVIRHRNAGQFDRSRNPVTIQDALC